MGRGLFLLQNVRNRASVKPDFRNSSGNKGSENNFALFRTVESRANHISDLINRVLKESGSSAINSISNVLKDELSNRNSKFKFLLVSHEGYISSSPKCPNK